MEEDNREVIAWCFDCKDPIYVGDPYIVHNDRTYHKECFELMNTYYDPYE